MMHRHQQGVALLGTAHQTQAQQRPQGQVERLPRLILGQARQGGVPGPGRHLAEVFTGEDQPVLSGAMYPHPGLAALFGKVAAQYRVAGDYVSQGSLQRRLVQFPDELQPAGNVISAGGRFQLPQQPQSVLAVGQRAHSPGGCRDDWQTPGINAFFPQLLQEQPLLFAWKCIEPFSQRAQRIVTVAGASGLAQVIHSMRSSSFSNWVMASTSSSGACAGMCSRCRASASTVGVSNTAPR